MCAWIHKQTLIMRNATCADVGAAGFYRSPDYLSHAASQLVPMRAQAGLDGFSNYPTLNLASTSCCCFFAAVLRSGAAVHKESEQ